MTTSTGWLEASFSPLLPLGAVRTVYPKVSRNALSHSSTSWLSLMHRTTPLESSGQADRDMVHLKQPIFNTQAQETVQNCSNYALVVVSGRVSRSNSSDAIRRGGVNDASVVHRF